MGRIFRPFSVGGFTIVPEGEDFPDVSGIPLVMGKKGAFGSGEHETTASCLTFLERLPLAGVTGIDLGSGTGILAIAAVKLGSGPMTAVDIDPAAALSCTSNAALNGVEEKVESICGELSSIPNGSYGLFIANIYADLHLALADEMVARTAPGGTLLLSGIPLQDKFDIQRRFGNLGCTLTDMEIMEEFVTLLLRKD